MKRRVVFLLMVGILPQSVGSPSALADELVYGYEANVPPYDPSEDWFVGGICDGVCSDSIENGHYVLTHTMAADIYNYIKWIAQPPVEPPPSYWVEWNFRSNHPLGLLFDMCDASFTVHLLSTYDVTRMYGDAAITFSGDTVIENLAIEEFHSYRMESADDLHYRISVDGLVFFVDTGLGSTGYHYIAFGGRGGCVGDQIPNSRNEWDFVRYGTIGFGERIVATDPPMGFLNSSEHAGRDRFTVTYDSPNYAYIDDIALSVTCATAPNCPEAPQVIATKRLDNGPPDVLEIVLDRPLPANSRTALTFSDVDPANPEIQFTQTVAYTFQLGDVDADGDWDLRDFASAQNCFLCGACLSDPEMRCRAFDLVTEIDMIRIRLDDLAAFVGILTGPGL